MKNLKLPPLAVAAIGVVLCLIAVGLLFGLVIKPNLDEIAAQKARYDAAYPDSTPSAQAAANAQLAAAKVKVSQTKSQWAIYESRLMPRFDVSGNRMVAWQELSRELTYNLGPSIERWIPTTGVVPLFSTVGLAGPPADPNAITAAPLIIPISGSGATGGGGGAGGGVGGSLSVGGDFRRILYHVQKWNSFKRLVLLDNLGLHGTSPFMSATYNAEVIIFPQGDDKPAPPIATGGAASGSGVSAGVTGLGSAGGPGAPPPGFAGGAPGGAPGAVPGDPPAAP